MDRPTEALVLSVLRQGIMASITGGWYYDPRSSSSINLLLMSIWSILFLVPLIIVIVLNTWYNFETSPSSVTSMLPSTITTPDVIIANLLFKNLTTATTTSIQLANHPAEIQSMWLKLFHSSRFLIWSIYTMLIGVGFTIIKVLNSRLQQHVFDLNLTRLETSISIFLAMAVSGFGACLLELGVFQDFWIIMLCFVQASSQYTLLKSVQPDASSPTHGFNRVVLLSRPFYFCMLACIIVICQAYLIHTNHPWYFLIYNYNIFNSNVISAVKKVSIVILMSYPLIFTLGVLPQISTFIVYVCEQIDVHLLGSTAATLGLKSALYSFTRSLLTAVLLYSIAAGSFNYRLSTHHNAIFSLYCGLLFALSYLLSRSSSDPTITFRVLHNFSTFLNNPSLWKPTNFIIAGKTTTSSSYEYDYDYDRAETSEGLGIGCTKSGANIHGTTESFEMSTILTTTDPTNSIARGNDLISQPGPSTSSTIIGAPSSPTMSRPSTSSSAANFGAGTSKLITSSSSFPHEISMSYFDGNQASPEKTNVSTHQNIREQDNGLVPTYSRAKSLIDNGEKEVPESLFADTKKICSVRNEKEVKHGDIGSVQKNESSPDDGKAGVENSRFEEGYLISDDDNQHRQNDDGDDDDDDISEKLKSQIRQVYLQRFKCDLISCVAIIVVVFALHVSAIFTLFQSFLQRYLTYLIVCWGLMFHYLLPQLRANIPWMWVSQPILRTREYNLFEVKSPAKLMWFDRLYAWSLMIERNLIYPLFWLTVITADAVQFREQTFPSTSSNATFLFVIVSLKLVRSTYNDPSLHYITLLFTCLFFNYDVSRLQDYVRQPFMLNFFIFSILHLKLRELMLKIKFLLDYLAPWQIPWGSAFHAFAQPFAVPHFAATLAQAVISALISAPLQPMLGSAFFLMSYVRPMKFWERDYNTRSVVDYTKTRLACQLERQRTGIDANRLDSIFYEHLTKCLQKRLCGDLALGRWGNVQQGDCFVMASDNLNCLVHIIEFGNGLCTFQLRGLEFKGTYCQQQEVEAITEGIGDDDGCCCCEPGHLPNLLSINAAFNQRWLAWQVTQSKYVVDGYSISDNSATQMLQPFDLRRALVTYYVKSIIYFTVTSIHLSRWLQNRTIYEALEYTKDESFVDVDPTFSSILDQDFDVRSCGVTKSAFCSTYLDWIQYCVERVKSDKSDRIRASLIANIDYGCDSFLVSLCFSLSLLARRSLSAASHTQQFHTVEFLLYGLHSLLKGDFRITSLHDEWIFEEMKFFKLVVGPSVRMCLKLHQDHFASPEEYDDNMSLYEAISGYQRNLFISHESDPAWRSAVLSNMPSLLALRHIVDDGTNQFKIIMLNKRCLSFRIIKLNKECVRGLWASQQQELIFLRNTDPERGSIQNAKQVLRNMINSSCDSPIGYPIYVSPLTTSFTETNDDMTRVFKSIGIFNQPTSVLNSISRLGSHLATCLMNLVDAKKTATSSSLTPTS